MITSYIIVANILDSTDQSQRLDWKIQDLISRLAKIFAYNKQVHFIHY